MAYDWATSFQNQYANNQASPYEGYEQDKMRYDMEMSKMREQLQVDLTKLRATSEYNAMDARQRQQLEAQLIAYRAKELPPEMARELVMGNQIHPSRGEAYPTQQEVPYAPETEGIADNILGGALGAALGKKFIPKTTLQGAVSGIAPLGRTMQSGAGSTAVANLLNKFENSTAKGVEKFGNMAGRADEAAKTAGRAGKATAKSASAIEKLLANTLNATGGVAEKAAGKIGKGTAEKNLGSILTKVAGKRLPSAIGKVALGSTPSGLVAGIVLPEIIDALWKTDEEKAREAYINSLG